MKIFILSLALIIQPIVSQAYGPTVGFEQCAGSSFSLPTVDLKNHNPNDCENISGHWKGMSISDWPRSQKIVIDVQFNAKPETYAICDQIFSCRGSNDDEYAPPESWYTFTGYGPIGLNVSGQIVCQGNVVDLLFRDYKKLYYRFHFEVQDNGDVKYSMCGQRPFLLKKTGP